MKGKTKKSKKGGKKKKKEYSITRCCSCKSFFYSSLKAEQNNKVFLLGKPWLRVKQRVHSSFP